MRDIDLIVIHHSASGLHTTVEDIDKWHRDRGWSQIGYHRVIESDGTVHDGRPVQIVGAHAKGSNQSSIGICVVGNNSKDTEKWTQEQEEALEKVVCYFIDLYPNAKVMGHRDTPRAATECPGIDVAEWLEQRGIDGGQV